MKILVLGGTSWLGGEVALAGLERDHSVTCLARGQSGQVPAGVCFLPADREADTAYDMVRDEDWDGVVDVSWQPGFVRGAVDALAARTATWVYVSSCSVYLAHDTIGADESATVLPPLAGDRATREAYGAAKVACELAVIEGVRNGRAVIARSGLIGGPGDHTDRTGYWPWRFAHPAADDGSVLVPAAQQISTQVLDVRDLALWLVRCIEDSSSGVFNVAGRATPLGKHLAAARKVAGHDGPLVTVSDEWLTSHLVQEWAGPRSLPLWLSTAGWEGFAARSTAAALSAGLVCRPLEETLSDVLAWENSRNRVAPRLAGLEPQEERMLIEAAKG